MLSTLKRNAGNANVPRAHREQAPNLRSVTDDRYIGGLSAA